MRYIPLLHTVLELLAIPFTQNALCLAACFSYIIRFLVSIDLVTRLLADWSHLLHQPRCQPQWSLLDSPQCQTISWEQVGRKHKQMHYRTVYR